MQEYDLVAVLTGWTIVEGERWLDVNEICDRWRMLFSVNKADLLE